MRVSAAVRTERGSASVLVVGAAGTVVLVLIGVLTVAGAVRDLHRVQAAADLAALAAAGGTSIGAGPDCRTAVAVAGANGARLSLCSTEPDGSVVVTAALHRRWPRGWGLPRTVSSTARAGVVDVAAPAVTRVPGRADRLEAPSSPRVRR
ncbi:MAG: Rv3654c family TadE-like protein [Ornithinibacter sp.]